MQVNVIIYTTVGNTIAKGANIFTLPEFWWYFTRHFPARIIYFSAPFIV